MLPHLLERTRIHGRSDFARHVLHLESGAALAQVVTLVCAPLIARLYGPEAFGNESIFFTVVNLATAGALGYPTAIVLPEVDQDAAIIAKATLATGATASVVMAAGLWLWGEALLTPFDAAQIIDFMVPIPVAAMIAVIATVSGQWLIRTGAYWITVRCNVITALVSKTWHMRQINRSIDRTSLYRSPELCSATGVLTSIWLVLWVIQNARTMGCQPNSDAHLRTKSPHDSPV